MIQADLHGKTGVPEDVLTSCCLGLLRLLADEDVIEVFSLARHRDGQQLNLAGVRSVLEFEFWPWLRNGGQPDAIATINAIAPPRDLKIVIEVKYGSGKSGDDQDQLAKYLNAARRRYLIHEIILIASHTTVTCRWEVLT